MADFNTVVEIKESDADDFILIRHNGVDRKQQRDVFAAGISNARWRNDVDYEAGSIVVASDLQAYVALQASGVNNLQPEDPVDNLGKWQLVVNKPDEFYQNVPVDNIVSDGEEFLVNKSGETHKFDQNTLGASVANARWINSVTYTSGSEITYNGEKYLALVDNINVTPSFANRSTWFKLKRFVDTTGMIHLYTSTLTPEGRLLKANGAAISRTQFPELFAKIGTLYGNGNGTTTFNLPDLRGEFLRFWDDDRGVDSGRGLGSSQGESFKSHTHENTAQVNSTNLGTKAVNSADLGNRTTSGGGSHVHTVNGQNKFVGDKNGDGNFDYGRSSIINPDDGDYFSMPPAGDHTHTINIGAHNHTIVLGSHNHSITLNNVSTGGSETRPRNIALVAYIEY